MEKSRPASMCSKQSTSPSWLLLLSKHGGKLRMGLLTNQTGLDAQGRRTIDILAHDAEAAVPGLKLKLLFSPEHGINGALDKEGIANPPTLRPACP